MAPTCPESGLSLIVQVDRESKNVDERQNLLFDVFFTFQQFCFKVAGAQSHRSLGISPAPGP